MQSELFLEILFFEHKPRLYLSLLMMTLLFLSFMQFTQLFIVPALELISELEGDNFAFFLQLNFHKICAHFHSKLSNLYLFKLQFKVFKDLGTFYDTLYHFKSKKSWKSLEVFLVSSLHHSLFFPFDFHQNILFL